MKRGSDHILDSNINNQQAAVIGEVGDGVEVDLEPETEEAGASAEDTGGEVQHLANQATI